MSSSSDSALLGLSSSPKLPSVLICLGDITVIMLSSCSLLPELELQTDMSERKPYQNQKHTVVMCQSFRESICTILYNLVIIHRKGFQFPDICNADALANTRLGGINLFN